MFENAAHTDACYLSRQNCTKSCSAGHFLLPQNAPCFYENTVHFVLVYIITQIYTCWVTFEVTITDNCADYFHKLIVMPSAPVIAMD